MLALGCRKVKGPVKAPPDVNGSSVVANAKRCGDNARD